MRTWIPRPPVVMVIDDDSDILKLLGMLFTSEGCVVREALHAHEALPALEGVDVVVVDQRMPLMSGTEFIGAARRAGAQCRFLVISGDPKFREDAREAGAEGFLPKPLDVRKMLGEVERLFALGPHR